MEISCDIIRDLLPLYAEDMVSEDSKQLVDNHLCGCDTCVKELAFLKKSTVIPAEVDTNALKNVKKTINKRQGLSILLACLLIPTILLGTFVFLTKPIYLPLNESDITIVEIDGENVHIHFGDEVDCFSIVATEYQREDKLTLTYTAYKRLWNVHYGNLSNAEMNLVNGEHDVPVDVDRLARITYNREMQGKKDSVLWGEDLSGNDQIWPEYWMPNLWKHGLILMAMLLVGFQFRKSRSVLYAAILPASYSFWELMITGGNWHYLPHADLLIYVCFVTGLAFLTWCSIISGLKFIEMNKS